MFRYHSVQEVIQAQGLRLVLVRGLPSPWSQAAKTILELKGLDHIVAGLMPGGPNPELLAWSGQNSAPLVAWRDEKPLHRWLDILNLAERLAPEPALVPGDAAERALMIELSKDICGERGIGWNRRLQMFAPMMNSANPPDALAQMAGKYGYIPAQAALAGARIAASLTALANRLKAQQARGARFFVGDDISALDIYWTAFMNVLDPLPDALCPMPADRRAMFTASDPQIRAALEPVLTEHRDRVFAEYFRSPMEY